MMMGTNVSRIGTDGAKCPAMRLRPLLFQHLATMRTWRLPPCFAKDGPSRKGLLLNDKESSGSRVAMATVMGNPYGFNLSTKPNLTRINCKNHDANKLHDHADHDEVEVDGEDDDQGRRIAAGPGSPSFRIFFEDAARATNDHDQNANLGQNEAAKETDSRRDVAMSKATSMQKRMMRRERKMRRHIKNMMSGKKREAANAVKNLLNAKACYHPSRGSTSLPAAEKTSFRP